jgi:hypothetical protein
VSRLRIWMAVAVAVAGTVACGLGSGSHSGSSAGSGGPGTPSAPSPTAATTAPAASSTPPAPPPPTATLHLYHVQFGTVGIDGANRLRLLVHSPATSLGVVVLPNDGGPLPAIRVCPITDLTAPAATTGCFTPSGGEALALGHSDSLRGIEIRYIGPTSGQSGATLDHVTVTYPAADRSVSVAVPSLDAALGGSVCKDNGCNPFLEMTPRHSGPFHASVSWAGVANARLVMLVGDVAAHAYLAHGTPYGSAGLADTSGDVPGGLSISGTLTTTESALALINLDLRGPDGHTIVDPVIEATWP